MERISRRAFASAGWGAASRVLGANGEVRVAVIGFRGHGRTHIRNYVRMQGVRLVALCDADRAVLDKEAAALKKEGLAVDTYQDVRKLLERKDLDAVSTATPNHWHALVTVWACQAGKDVCVEKPVCHNLWEGRQMVEAARRYRRMVQADLDLRSERANDQIAEYLRARPLGRIVLVRGFIHKYRPSIGKTPGRGHIPDTLDYELWCGPARKGRIDRAELHYDWHWVWDTGNGELGNTGPHQLDEIRWMLGEQGLPRRVMSFGGRFGYDDAGETPNTQVAYYEYPTAPILFEVRGLSVRPGTREMDFYEARAASGLKLRNVWDGKGGNTGVIVECEGGYVDMDAMAAFDNAGRQIRKFENAGSVNPQANFIQAVRSRKESDLKTTIENGHWSTALSHTGNISYRLGGEASPRQIRDAIGNVPDLQEAFDRFTAHLARHGVDIEKTRARLGPWLSLSPAAERFQGEHAARANGLVRRQYRRPFVIPERV